MLDSREGAQFILRMLCCLEFAQVFKSIEQMLSQVHTPHVLPCGYRIFIFLYTIRAKNCSFDASLLSCPIPNNTDWTFEFQAMLKNFRYHECQLSGFSCASQKKILDTRLAKAIAKAETASATFVKKALVAALCSATSDMGYFRLVGGSTTESSGTK